MAAISDNSITLTAQCLCKANTFISTISKSELPLQASICHCDTCRHLTGALYTTDTPWPTPRAEIDISKLKVFPGYPSNDLLFCPACSSPMFFAHRNDPNRLLEVFTGVLSNEAVNLIKYTVHKFVLDTRDGGASAWLRHNPDGSEIKRFKFDSNRNGPEELPVDWVPDKGYTGYEAKGEDSIPIRCKCKGVDLVLRRGGGHNGRSKDELSSTSDPEAYKISAGFCGCDSCRLQGGVDVINWAFAEMKNISFSNTEKAFPTQGPELKRLVDARDPDVGTLTYYSSSEKVERYFCSTCSACVFYTIADHPDYVDIAVGVLDASDGALAEGMLLWPYGARISYREDGQGGWREKLFNQVEMEAEEFRVARGYPKHGERIGEDEIDCRNSQ